MIGTGWTGWVGGIGDIGGAVGGRGWDRICGGTTRYRRRITDRMRVPPSHPRHQLSLHRRRPPPLLIILKRRPIRALRQPRELKQPLHDTRALQYARHPRREIVRAGERGDVLLEEREGVEVLDGAVGFFGVDDDFGVAEDAGPVV